MELEESNKRMENLLARMEQNFSNFLEQKLSTLMLNMTPEKDKVVEGDKMAMVDQTPILPSSPAHPRSQTEGETQNNFKKDWGKFHTPNPPKIDLHCLLGKILGISCTHVTSIS